jgi:hypothetical protein
MNAADVDGIAFTRGPGKVFSVTVGLSVSPDLTNQVSLRYDRLSWRWFQRCKDTRSSAEQTTGWRSSHGMRPLPLNDKNIYSRSRQSKRMP